MAKKETIPLSTKIASIVLLLIMVVSVAGFALTMSGGSGSGALGSGNNDIPLQQIQEQGELLWVAVLNSELFVFEDIDNFLGDFDSETKAEQIKLNRQLYLYVDPSFASNEAQFLLEKALYGLRIDVQRVFDQQCTPDTLIITNEDTNISGDCIVFSANETSAFDKAESLTYHLVK